MLLCVGTSSSDQNADSASSLLPNREICCVFSGTCHLRIHKQQERFPRSSPEMAAPDTVKSLAAMPAVTLTRDGAVWVLRLHGSETDPGVFENRFNPDFIADINKALDTARRHSLCSCVLFAAADGPGPAHVPCVGTRPDRIHLTPCGHSLLCD